MRGVVMAMAMACGVAWRWRVGVLTDEALRAEDALPGPAERNTVGRERFILQERLVRSPEPRGRGWRVVDRLVLRRTRFERRERFPKYLEPERAALWRVRVVAEGDQSRTLEVEVARGPATAAVGRRGGGGGGIC